MSKRRQFERRVAECVVRSDEALSLYELRESPDADVLHEDDFHIGLEIVRQVKREVLDARDRMEVACRRIESVLRDASLRGFIRVYFEVDQLAKPRRRAGQSKVGFRAAGKAWSKDYGAWLDGVGAAVLNLLAEPPAEPAAWETLELSALGVRRIARIEWRPTDREISVGLGWCTRTAPGDTKVDRCLANKHEKLASYRAKAGGYFREYWLAIGPFGPGTGEDGGFQMLFDRQYETDYDRVLLIGSNFVDVYDVTPHPPV